MSNKKNSKAQNQEHKQTKKEKLELRRQAEKKKQEELAAKKARNKKIIIGAVAVVVLAALVIVLVNVIPVFAGGARLEAQMDQTQKIVDGNYVPVSENPDADHPRAEITMQDDKKITIELDATAAPKTVANFVKLAESGFYDGLTFHRIMPGFMIQGGDPSGDGTGGSEETISGEFSDNGWDNPIKHYRGVISMARSTSPDSASSQFFITNADDTATLDGKYATFGRVIGGMDVVDALSATELEPVAGEAEQSTPVTPPVIKSIKIITQ